MKRKQAAAVILAVSIVVAGVISGCGEKDNATTASSSSASATSSASTSSTDDGAELTEEEKALDALPIAEGDVSLDDCVKLGEYKGLKLTKSVSAPSSDEVTQYAESLKEPEAVEDKDAKAKDGDTVNINYEGKIDGEAFDGGTAENYDLVLGSDTFIDGFEEGVIGMKVGEEKDINVTFPDDYTSEDLQGKDAVFTVKLNSISRPGKVSDDDLEAARKELEEEAAGYADDELRNDAWAAIKENTEVTQLRKSDIEKYTAELEDEITKMIEMLDTDEAGYLEMQGMTQETFEQNKRLYAKGMAEERLIIDALAKAEGISETDEEQQKAAEEFAEKNGATVDEMKEQAGEETMNRYVLLQRLLDKVVSYADVTEEKVDSAETVSEATE